MKWIFCLLTCLTFTMQTSSATEAIKVNLTVTYKNSGQVFETLILKPGEKIELTKNYLNQDIKLRLQVSEKDANNVGHFFTLTIDDPQPSEEMSSPIGLRILALPNETASIASGCPQNSIDCIGFAGFEVNYEVIDI